MSKDVFVWAMTAYQARTGLNAFRQQIKDHVASQQPLPLDLLIAMLPFSAENSKDFVNRGPLKITGTQFENIAPADLRLVINDLAMKQYTVITPAAWRGSVVISGNIITITFSPPLQLDVPRIDELGISRSEYQSLDQIQSDLRYVLSHLVDSISSDLETIIQVDYNANGVREIPPEGKDATKLRMYDVSRAACGAGPADPNDPANPDPDANDFYVWRQRTTGLSYIHETNNNMEGGTVGFDLVYGPDTYNGCQNYLNANCPEDICPAP